MPGGYGPGGGIGPPGPWGGGGAPGGGGGPRRGDSSRRDSTRTMVPALFARHPGMDRGAGRRTARRGKKERGWGERDTTGPDAVMVPYPTRMALAGGPSRPLKRMASTVVRGRDRAIFLRPHSRAVGEDSSIPPPPSPAARRHPSSARLAKSASSWARRSGLMIIGPHSRCSRIVVAGGRWSGPCARW